MQGAFNKKTQTVLLILCSPQKKEKAKNLLFFYRLLKKLISEVCGQFYNMLVVIACVDIRIVDVVRI